MNKKTGQAATCPVFLFNRSIIKVLIGYATQNKPAPETQRSRSRVQTNEISV
jgi:hypothetical protein